MSWVFKEVSRQLAEMDEANIPDHTWVINDEDFTTEEVVKMLIGSQVQSIRDFGWMLQEICDREAGLVEDVDDEWLDEIS